MARQQKIHNRLNELVELPKLTWPEVWDRLSNGKRCLLFVMCFADVGLGWFGRMWYEPEPKPAEHKPAMSIDFNDSFKDLVGQELERRNGDD